MGNAESQEGGSGGFLCQSNHQKNNLDKTKVNRKFQSLRNLPYRQEESEGGR